MSDLIPDQPDVVAQAPTSRVSGFQYARAGSYLTNGLDKLAQGLDAVAVPLAQQKAASDLADGAVTRDVNGAVQVTAPGQNGLPIFGPAGVAYDHAIAAGMLARGDNQSSADIADLRAKNEGNPGGFKTASDAYLSNLKANNPGTLGEAMFENASRLTTQHYDGMVADQARVGIADAKQSIVDGMTSKQNTLAALALAGKTDDPLYAQAQAEYGALSAQLVKNPAFGVSADVQAANDKANHDTLMGYAISGRVDKDMTGPGGIIGARKNLQEAISDPNLDLTPAEREKFQSIGEARIVFNTGQRASDVAANQQDYAALEEASKSPLASAKLNEPIWQAAIAKAQSLGDTETAQKIGALHQVWQIHQPTAGLSPNQSLNAQGLAPDATPRPGGSPPVGFDAAVSSVMRMEGGFTVDNGGPTRFGVSERANPDVNAQTLTPDAAKEIYRSRYWNAIGGDSLPPNMQFVALYGAAASGPEKAKEWLAQAGGDPHKFLDIQDAFQRSLIANDPATYGKYAQSWQRRLNDERAMVGGAALSANGTPFSDADLKANPFLGSTWVKSLATDPTSRNAYGEKLGTAIAASLKDGFAPSVDTMANYMQIAKDNPALQEQAMHIQASVQGMAVADGAVNLPPGQGRAYIDAIVQGAQGKSLYEQELAGQARDFYEKGVEALTKDPFGTAAAKGWGPAPNPLDFSDPTKLAIGLHQRSDLATAISKHTGDDSIGALGPDELPQVKSIISNGTPQQVSMLQAAVASLPEARQKATIAQIGQTGADGRVFAIAGALQKDNPQAAADVAAGQALLKDKAEYAPKPEQANAELSKYLPPANFSPNARETVAAGVTAIYAKLSADAGDTTQVLNPTRYKEAVDQITGGMVKWNGAPLAPPWYKSGQDGLRLAMHSLTDADLAGSRTREGTPLTADALRPADIGSFVFGGPFKLENRGMGDGTYRIFTGTPAAKAYVMDDARGPDRKPFVLDLGAKKPMVDGLQAQASASGAWFTSRASGPDSVDPNPLNLQMPGKPTLGAPRISP